MSFISMRYCKSCQRRRSVTQFAASDSVCCMACEGISKTVTEDAAILAKGSSARPKSSPLDTHSKV